MKKRRIIVLSLIAYAGWSYFHVPEPTILSVRIGLPFEEVVRMSTFPVMASSNIPTDAPHGFGTTLVTKPAVIIKFNDPQYGFTLPATTFAGISYLDGNVSTIRTSPMLSKLPFNQAFEEFSLLQRQFQASGWRLDDGTSWVDLTAAGRVRLHEDLRREKNGRVKVISLVAPGKYSLYLMISCAGRCDSGVGLDRYLIDISVGKDFGDEIEQRNHQREEAMTP
jgi:hypothetical protein